MQRRNARGHFIAEDRRNNPLSPHFPAFEAHLAGNGYTHATITSKLWLVAKFGKWIRRRGQAAADVNEAEVARFIKTRKRERRVRNGELRTLKQYLRHLRTVGVVAELEPAFDQTPIDKVLDRYERYLHCERALMASTINRYRAFVRRFLERQCKKRAFALQRLRSVDISRSVLHQAHAVSPRQAQMMVVALRSFFRFLFEHGDIKKDLGRAIPRVANWRQSAVPRYLNPEDVKRVLSACDPRKAVGRRNYAILLLLARLGLRASEVVQLELDDIDWRAGDILVRGKGLAYDRMPLPVEVGKAIASYLCDRPTCKTRRVFVCMTAPHRGFAQASTLSVIVQRCIQRAGVEAPVRGAHVLRHSLATSMLRAGATLSDIGKVLRHRAANTTEIYAKVDFQSLRPLAHPWAIGGAE